MSEGWKCPECGRVHAPHIDGCTPCNDELRVSWPLPQPYKPYVPPQQWPWPYPYPVTC